jgi:putative flippase GtrA
LIKHFFTKQFVGFLFVGMAAAFLHWLARLLLSIWLPFSSAVVIAYAVGMTVAFILNRIYIFPISDKAKSAQVRDFILVNLSFFPVVWYFSLKINNWLNALDIGIYSESLAHAIAISLPMFLTFLIYKFLTFREKKHE